jgi:serine/threonine protein kinase
VSVDLISSTVYLRQLSGTIEASIDWYQEKPADGELPTLTIGKNIGKGAFSKIVKVDYLDRDWALKVPIVEKDYEDIRSEVDILVSLNRGELEAGQEHFVQVIASVIFKAKPMMLMKFYKGGDLCARVDKSLMGISLESALKIMNQMLKALTYLKKEKIIHRDIKLRNIFIEEGDVIKLGDFGFAMREDNTDERAVFCGTSELISPEILNACGSNNYPYGSPSDVWGAGCAMFNAFNDLDLVLDRPGPGKLENLKTQQKAAVENFDSRMNKIATRKGLPESEALTLFHKILKGMLTLDPSERLTPEAGTALLDGGSL